MPQTLLFELPASFLESAQFERVMESICAATGMLSAGLPCAGATESEENATCWEEKESEKCRRSAYRPRARVNTPDCLRAPSLRGGARARTPLCPLQACLHPERLFCPMLAGAELTDKGEGGGEEWGQGGRQPGGGVHSCAPGLRPRPPAPTWPAPSSRRAGCHRHCLQAGQGDLGAAIPCGQASCRAPLPEQ